MGGAAQSPSSSHPSHHDTVVDESLSRMSTDSPQRSSKVIDEESSSKQPSMSTADTSVNTVNMYTSNAYMSIVPGHQPVHETKNFAMDSSWILRHYFINQFIQDEADEIVSSGVKVKDTMCSDVLDRRPKSSSTRSIIIGV